MRILYGVVGEGMGHAMRSRVVLDELIKRHEVHVVVSGRAYDYLRTRAWRRRKCRVHADGRGSLPATSDVGGSSS
jgi:uncharacterized protein (TIGR00661 family)